MKQQKQQSLFCFGIVFYCFILMFFNFAVIKNLHSMFLVPVTEGLGMERSAFSLLFTISGVAVAFALPVVTKMLKKYPARYVVGVCVLLVAGGFASYSLARAPWHFYIIAAIVGIGTAGCTQMVGSLLINNWFIDRKGLAMGIAFTGSGFGMAILSPVLTALLARFGWQFSYVAMWALIAIFCLPLTWMFAYRDPAERGAEPYRGRKTKQKNIEDIEDSIEDNRTETPAPGAKLGDIRTKSYFWLFLAAICIWSLVIGGVHMHIAAYLTDIGHTAGFIAFVFSFEAVCIVVAKIVLGMVCDARGTRAGILFMAGTFILAMVCLLLADAPFLALLFALCYSCGSIFTSVGMPQIVSGFFGQRDYADILSLTTIAYTIGASFGPFLSGLVFDATGSYMLIWKVYLALFVLAFAIVWMLKNYLDKRYKEEWFSV